MSLYMRYKPWDCLAGGGMINKYKDITWVYAFIITLIPVIMLSGCVQNPVQPNDPRFSPVTANTLRPPPPVNGSIFQEGFANNLWEDQRARRIGDIITVLLQENTTSSKTNSTSITKDSSNESPAPSIFGTTPSFTLPGSDSNMDLSSDFESNRAFSGAADADQSNNLSGSITVTVSDVMPNGVLVVRGEKWLTLGQGEEYIRITGLIRPSDINPDNTVVSTKMADARITYAGRGALADSGKMGWMSKFFNSIFWPL